MVADKFIENYGRLKDIDPINTLKTVAMDPEKTFSTFRVDLRNFADSKIV